MATLKSFSIDGRTVKSLFINGKPVKLGAEPVEYTGLCFTAEEADSTVQLHRTPFTSKLNLLTSTDGNTWTPYEEESIITLANIGDKVYFKAIGSNMNTGTGFNNPNSSTNYFVMTGKIAASGNVNSLLEEDEETARTMSLANVGSQYRCFPWLFHNCRALTTVPELPATTIGDYTYIHMFESCRNITQGPYLPATALGYNSYNEMFKGCTKLNSIRVAFTTWNTNWGVGAATGNWLPSNTGTFECPLELITNTSTRSNSTVPSSWSMVAV